VKTIASRVLLGVALGAFAALSLQCTSSTSKPSAEPAKAASAAGLDPWSVIYGVLENPRCMNCHPAGNSPLQGDDSHVHAQFVTRGADGQGAVGMRCETCHQTRNLDAPHLPPGAADWHLPKPETPLVFQGKTSGELCRQLRDPTKNGGRTPQQLVEHMETPLVLWGWAPGPGRAAIPTPHDEFMKALKTWIDGGCGCPEK
jgi:cytochrome c5